MQEANYIQWLVLALIQGLTEYLPISSSAHLILVSKVMQWQDQGVVMDIAAHGGSLLAVLWYFKDELIKLLRGNNWPLFIQLSLGSIPLAIFGLLFADTVETLLRTPIIIALASIVFGIILYWTDAIQKKCKARPNGDGSIKNRQAMLIGVAQVFALIPGASRSGVTMSAAMALGYSRTAAARFSFLLAIPALLMTSAYGVLKIIQQPTAYNLLGVLIVLLVSFLASLLSIKLFLKLIEKISISVFVWYRIILAVVILWTLQ